MFGLQRQRKSEKGVVMVIAALLLVTLLVITALVVDVGQLYTAQARLQTAADAAALAGANTLFTTKSTAQATADAKTYVSSNLSDAYNYSDVSDIPNGTFTVNLNQNVKFYFAPVIGISESTVRASATATASTVVATNNVVPWGVEQQVFVYGQEYQLKYGAGDKPAQGGNYGALALGGNGASRYRDNIKFGYTGQIHIDDTLTTEPGNMAGPTDQGVTYRKSLCTHGCSFSTQIEANCPRVVVTPVIDKIPDGGRGTTKVVGFAAFFLEGDQDSASKGQKDVIGRFLRWAAPGETGTGSDFGLVSVRLIK